MDPLPFILSKDGVLSLHPDAQQFLLQLPPSTPLQVLSVVGKYRTGKSFLLNRVVLQEPSFRVGHTINPCTKGIWLCPKLLDGQLLVLDVEGFGGIDENPAHDSRLFIAALLCSSLMLYNSVGVIDENALSSLGSLLSMAGELCGKSGLQVGFPALMWVLRDFAVKLVDKEGLPISEQQYFENSLEPLRGMAESTETKNRTRRIIKDYFKERECITLVRPVQDQRLFHSLNDQPDTALRSEFLAKTKLLRSKVQARLRPKVMAGKRVNGPGLAHLAQAVCQAINSNALPSFTTAWLAVWSDHNSKVLAKLTRDLLASARLSGSVSAVKLEEMARSLKQKLTAEFGSKVLELDQRAEEQLRVAGEEIGSALREQNRRLAEETLQQEQFRLSLDCESLADLQLKLEAHQNGMKVKASQFGIASEKVQSMQVGLAKQKLLELCQKLQTRLQDLRNQSQQQLAKQQSRVEQQQVQAKRREEQLNQKLEHQKRLWERKFDKLHESLAAAQQECALAHAEVSSTRSDARRVREESMKHFSELDRREQEFKRLLEAKEEALKAGQQRARVLEEGVTKAHLELRRKGEELQYQLQLHRQEVELVELRCREQAQMNLARKDKEYEADLKQKLRVASLQWQQLTEERVREAQEELHIKRVAQEQKERTLRAQVQTLKVQLAEKEGLERQLQKLRSYNRKAMGRLQEVEAMLGLKIEELNLCERKADSLAQEVEQVRRQLSRVREDADQACHQKCSKIIDECESRVLLLSGRFEEERQQAQITLLQLKKQLQKEEGNRAQQVTISKARQEAAERSKTQLQAKLKMQAEDWKLEIERLAKEATAYRVQLQRRNQEVELLRHECQLSQQRFRQRAEEQQELTAANIELGSRLEKSQRELGEARKVAEQLREDLLGLQSDQSRQVRTFRDELDKMRRSKGAGDWQVEKSILQNQLEMQSGILKNHEKLIASLIGIQNSKQDSPGPARSELSRLEVMLEEKTKKLDRLRATLKAVVSFRCQRCRKEVLRAHFQQHLDSCPGARVGELEPMTLAIIDTQLREEAGKTCVAHVVSVTDGPKAWTVTRRYRDFCKLAERLSNDFDYISTPQTWSRLVSTLAQLNTKKPTRPEDKRKELEQFLQDCLRIPEYRTSEALRLFLSEEDQCRRMRGTTPVKAEQQFSGKAKRHSKQNLVASVSYFQRAKR